MFVNAINLNDKKPSRIVKGWREPKRCQHITSVSVQSLYQFRGYPSATVEQMVVVGVRVAVTGLVAVAVKVKVVVAAVTDSVGERVERKSIVQEQAPLCRWQGLS